MRKILAATVAALTFGGAVAATAPAQARPYGYYGGSRYYGGGRYYHHHGNDAGVAVAAGVVGLALGAALANNSGRGYYSNGYYGRPYAYSNGGYYSRPYYGGYGYDGGYAVCTSSRLVWDPYIHRRVEVVDRYAC
jgi:hypothetical protein